MSELLPCPFCGGEAELTTFGLSWEPLVYGVQCIADAERGFDAHGHQIAGFGSAEKAIAAWNSRAERIYATGGIIAQAECRDVCASISEFTCSSCGFNCDLTSWISLFDGDSGRHRHHHFGTPNYCPNCGCKVVGE